MGTVIYILDVDRWGDTMHCCRCKGVIPFVLLLPLFVVFLPANLFGDELDSLEYGEFEHVLVHESSVFLTTGKGLLVALDVTDPTTPLLQDTLWLPKSPTDMMIVHGTDFLITVEDDSGLCVIDISEPSDLILAYINRDYPVDLLAQETPASETSRLYLSEGANIQVVDFQGPDTFSEIATYTHDGIIKGMEAREYSLYVSCRMDGLTILDMWNSASPLTIGHYNGWVNDLSLPPDPEATYLLTLRSQSEVGEFGILDLSTPSAPTMAGTFQQEGGYGSTVTFHAVAQWDNEYAIIPITWEPEQEDNTYALYIVDFLDHTIPWPIWHQDMETQARDVALSQYNGYLLVATVNECLIYDVAVPASPVLVSTYPTHDTVEETRSDQPQSFCINSVYPNPFNPGASVTLTLPQKADLQVIIYDIMGREVAKLAHGEYISGQHTFRFNAANLASGVYFIQATMNSRHSLTRKVTLIK